MPSQLPVPTIDVLLESYTGGVRGDRDRRDDTRTGSLYDLFGGLGAVVFARLAARDRAIFRALYFDFSEADDLDRQLQQRFGTALVRPTRGAGTAWFRRPNTLAGGGTIWAGSRIDVLPLGVATPTTYLVATDTPTTSASLPVPVLAEKPGKGSAIDTLRGNVQSIRLQDGLWDPSWGIDWVRAVDGTEQEQPEAARARVRKSRFDERVGYAKSITDALIAAGATNVALFPSDFLASNPTTGIESIGTLDADGYGDCGLNHAFVSDSGFQSPTALLNACRIAMDKWAIAGSALQVWGMRQQLVTLAITVRLWKDPGRAFVDGIKAGVRAAVRNYFDTRNNPFHFRLPAMRGAILRSVRELQSVAISASPSEPTLASLFNTIPIQRFYVQDGAIAVSVLGPAA